MLTTNQRYSCRRNAEGLLKCLYTSDEIDAVAAYCGELDRAFFVPGERIDGRSRIQFRLRPPRNNQVIGVNWADDFDLAATLDRLKGP